MHEILPIMILTSAPMFIPVVNLAFKRDVYC